MSKFTGVTFKNIAEFVAYEKENWTDRRYDRNPLVIIGAAGHQGAVIHTLSELEEWAEQNP